jgi:Vacuolar 14 Fab1-binding region
MQNELGKIVEMVVPMFQDSHPRVRYAACQCVYVGFLSPISFFLCADAVDALSVGSYVRILRYVFTR